MGVIDRARMYVAERGVPHRVFDSFPADMDPDGDLKPWMDELLRKAGVVITAGLFWVAGAKPAEPQAREHGEH